MQLLQVEDELPNNVRTIVGLQPKEESVPENLNDLASGDNASSEDRNKTSADEQAATSNSIASAPFYDNDVELESHCDMGVNQFL